MFGLIDEVATETLRYYGFNAFLVLVLLTGLWLIIKNFLAHQAKQDTEHSRQLEAQEIRHCDERKAAKIEFAACLSKIVEDSRADKEAIRREAHEEHKQLIGLFADLRDRIHCVKPTQIERNDSHQTRKTV